MNKLTLVLLIILQLNNSNILGQENFNIKYVNRLSNNNIVTFNVKQKFKSSIAEDTSIINSKIILKKNNNGFTYNIYFLEDNKFSRVIVGDAVNKVTFEYYIDNNTYSKYNLNIKKTGFYGLLQYLPIWNFECASNILDAKEIKFKNGINYYKDYYYSIDSNLKKHVANKIIITKSGIQYESVIVENVDLDTMIKFIEKPKEFLKTKKMYTYETKRKATTINKIILEKLKIDSSKSEYYLLDFFYQSCLPCIESIPKLKEIRNDNLNLNIIGIDPVLRDTLNIDKFKKRYQIDYEVITNLEALDITKELNISIFPTTFLIDSKGNIKLINEGIIDEKFLKKINKSVKPN